MLDNIHLPSVLAAAGVVFVVLIAIHLLKKIF